MQTGDYSNFEIHTMSVAAYAHAFQAYPTVLDRYFARYGLNGDVSAASQLEPWLPMSPWLHATHAIVEDVGGSTVYSIGKRVGGTVPLPPEIESAMAALSSVDIAYHLHHRRDGEIMFDPATGTMLDGIGHLRCVPESDSSVKMVCDNPYPCDFDRGLLAGIVGRFEPAVSVMHTGSTCRKKGEPDCSYLVQW